MAILLRKKDQKSLKKVNEKDWKIEKRLKKDHLSEVSLAYSLLTSFMWRFEFYFTYENFYSVKHK